MSNYPPPFEIHVHCELRLRIDLSSEQISEALKPLWKYAGARSFNEARSSLYDNEPGILLNQEERSLNMCWTVRGDEDFRQVMFDLCANLNEITDTGAPIEVTFYDAEFESDDDDDRQTNSRDDFTVYFVGPTPAAIIQVQRDLLVGDTVELLERHFDASELGGVVAEIDKLFLQRYEDFVRSMEAPSSATPSEQASAPGLRNTNGKRPRHLH